MIRVDLHLHSHVSDGQVSPSEVVRAAAAARLDVIALTDHDTAAGVPEAIAAAAARRVRVVPGIEISTRYGPHEFHVLGYWIDAESAPILAHQESAVARRARRMERMIERLAALGKHVSYEAVLEAAGPARSLGRPHLARALLAAGHIRYFAEAFELYISDSGPAFVVENFPTPAEAIETLHAAGGVAVWAHPPLEIFPSLIRDFHAWGLDGVECFRPNVAPEDALRLERGARELGLFPTGGSDWHGPQRGQLGEFSVPGDRVAEMLAVGAVDG